MNVVGMAIGVAYEFASFDKGMVRWRMKVRLGGSPLR